MCYIIRVSGHLDILWQTWLGDLSITHEEDGTTRLEGVIPDRAAVYGVLLKMCDLGLTLLYLEASVPASVSSELRTARRHHTDSF